MTAEPTIGVLALQGDVREHLRALAGAGVRTATVRRPAELEAVDALVIPGGESTTMWKLATAFELMEPLRKRVEAGMPAYGTCAGMIMLADRITGGIEGQQTIGGIDMTVRRNAFGRQVDSFEAEVPLTGMGDTPYHAVFIRAPWVENVGEGVEILGRAETGPNVGRIVAVRQGRLMATSFHPELTGDFRVHHYFADLVRRAMDQED
ncbi:pyridoxal 5'-phosphate synthase glutaminase subunit PdxT [Actinomadura namibiensis]|uniref:Pyridoxal 5'-phosphate synthase subunit PdxT n=1 Tax=Actinomadura namibiensis TaxID=182080 RepID=A0A7W3LXV1_ACTNM|nr:pyridoxal 5'-phosphate synthase glutaminase subunit PdxT [Actinomadura namibiensis]MBA8956303.1 5'-phosphate synthase pdxT subunit [Actinomadura namibiensis]